MMCIFRRIRPRWNTTKKIIIMKKIILITKTALEKIPPVISDLYILLDLGYRPSIIVTGISQSVKKREENPPPLK